MPAENRGPEVSGSAGFFLALSTVAIVLRCYSRLGISRIFGLDDYFSVLAWILFVFYCGFCITGVQHGTGQHAWNIPPTEIPVGLKWWWACEPVYVLSNMALKLSIGIFLLKIAVSKVHKAILWAVILVSQIYGAFFFLLFVLQCRPSAYFWTKYTGGKGTCINPKVTVDATYVYSAISCWGDWTFGILPAFIVWNLQMNTRTKLSVAAILALGAVASTATIVRIPYVKGMSNMSDFLYATTDVAIWSTCETGIGITASCIATLRPLFRSFLLQTKIMGGSSSRGASNPWHGSNANAGYVRSKSERASPFNDEIALRSPVGKEVVITTTVESDFDLEKGDGPNSSNPRLGESQQAVADKYV
ncbi:hypothetical protein B0O99DRAFT_265631 [Bisporella sp. PMI_857]|nr:hypothetical protein B0O99DRAFT_265631 [Bisporella sp. PMI_857]